MAKLVVPIKPYLVGIRVEPSNARRERGEGGLRELTTFVLGAPEGSPLRHCSVEPDHRHDFPRLRLERSARSYVLWFRFPADANTDALVDELYTVFAKNDWERDW